MEVTPFTCPRCETVSHHPMDGDYGYCARCHAFTGSVAPSSRSAHDKITERLDRVDTALAKRVGEMIRKNTAIKLRIERWQQAYPLTVFPEPDMAKARVLLEAGGLTLDAVSASTIRHVLQQIRLLLDDPDAI